jgi:uncharacterized protein
MRRGRWAALALAAALALPAAAEVRIPALTGPVVDAAGVLDARAVAALDRLARAGRASEGGAGPQLQYLLVPTLDGEDIESFSMRAAEAWKIGTKGKDNGVLVVVAVKDRKVRIEVGGGVEGGLTDAQAGRIIRTVIVPAFRESRYGDGLHAAGRQILATLGALPQGSEPAPAQRASRPPPPSDVGGLIGALLSMGSPLIFLLIVVFIIVRVLFAAKGRGGRHGPWGGGPWGGGSSGGGWSSGGGGGWSGGGGGFSGGGASGSW